MEAGYEQRLYLVPADCTFCREKLKMCKNEDIRNER